MNYIWFLIILISIISAAVTGKIDALVQSVMSGAQKSIEVAIYLAGIMAFWLGIMKIAEKSGLVAAIARLLTPVAKKLFPDIPNGNPAVGDIAMNPIREDGTWDNCPLTNRLLSASMECLKNIDNLILVGCGDIKVEAIQAALRTGCIDTLITDETTARDILEYIKNK